MLASFTLADLSQFITVCTNVYEHVSARRPVYVVSMAETPSPVVEGELKGGSLVEGDIQKRSEDDAEVAGTSQEGRGQGRTFELTTWKKVAAGLVIVVAIALSWVGSTQTAKSTYDTSFTSPYFMVWSTTAWMSLTFPLLTPSYFIREWLQNRACSPRATLLKLWR